MFIFYFSTNEKHKSQEMNENSKKQLLNKNKIVKQLIIQTKWFVLLLLCKKKSHKNTHIKTHTYKHKKASNARLQFDGLSKQIWGETSTLNASFSQVYFPPLKQNKKKSMVREQSHSTVRKQSKRQRSWIPPPGWITTITPLLSKPRIRLPVFLP